MSEKEGIERLASALVHHGVSLIATDGTYSYLSERGINARPVSQLTGFQQLLGGRVKTLHPAIFAPILAQRDNREHMEELRRMGMEPIDIVVSSLYDFQGALRKGADPLEHIDIGGVSLIRAAAKNYRSVAILTSNTQYDRLIAELESKGGLSEEFLKELAAEAFEAVALYDGIIARYMSDKELTDVLILNAVRKSELRYGENPYQKAAVYRSVWAESAITDGTLVHGKPLSYNNILDLNTTLDLLGEFKEPCAVVVKHSNPVGAACDTSAERALRMAYECDPVSAYGCVLGINREFNEEMARYLSRKFVEVVVAPSISKEALDIVSAREKMRVLTLDSVGKKSREMDVRRITGGYLVQTVQDPPASEIRTVTDRSPVASEMESLLFAWKVVRYVWSNAVVLSKGKATVGIGGGQPNRVDAVRIAVSRSAGRAAGSVLASDAFFPFRDGVDEAAAGGVTAIIQPGGSIRDSEVIQAANEHGMAMLFTGHRLFRH